MIPGGRNKLLGPVVLRLECASESPGGLAKTQIAGPTWEDSLGLGPDLKIRVSDKFTGGVDAAGPVVTLWKALADLNSETRK